MRILLTNDDGIASAGLHALAHELAADNEVFISAPDSERSGAGHSFTYKSPLRARAACIPGLETVPAYAVSGTPADCVKLGCGNLFTGIDMIVSGINLGANRGTDVFYSGTVAAAMEGALNGTRAVAVSNISFEPKDYGACLRALRFGMKLMEKDASVMMLNINAPDCAADELLGIRLTPLSRQEYRADYEERVDPYSKPYYWTPTERVNRSGPDSDDDERWTEAGYAAITPLLTDLTDFATLERLKTLETEAE